MAVQKFLIVCCFLLFGWLSFVSAATPAFQLENVTVGYSGFSSAFGPIWMTVEHRGRIIGFCRINPNVGTKTVATSIDRYVKELGMRGIKLHPEIDHFKITHEKILAPIFDKARDYQIPIIFHSGGTPDTDPLMIGQLAAQYPKVTVILGHMGLYEGCRKAAIVASKLDNVFLETSAVGWLSHHFAPAVLKVGPEKVLYGSDHPYNSSKWKSTS